MIRRNVRDSASRQEESVVREVVAEALGAHCASHSNHTERDGPQKEKQGDS